MVNVLLVGGVCEFGAVLAKKLRAVGAHVYILDTLAADEIASADPTSDGDTGIESVIGSPQNAPLVRRLIAECEVTILKTFLASQQNYNFFPDNATFSLAAANACGKQKIEARNLLVLAVAKPTLNSRFVS